MNRALIGLAVAATTQTIVMTAPARATPTENYGIRVLPLPGKMTIDGKFNDWDLSGGVFCSDNVQTGRDTMAVWMHAMYDTDNLYLLARFRDDTPLNNPGQTIADYGWSGDSLQFRIITAFGTPNERVSHWTNWQGRDGRDLIDIAYGRTLHDASVKDARDLGARQAFTKDADGKGYIQEIAIPWKLITKDGLIPDAKSGMRLTIEPNFTVGLKGRASFKDIFQPNIRPDRVFTFRAYNVWGTASLETAGHVVPRPVRLADAREFPVSMQDGLPRVDWTGLMQRTEVPGIKNISFTMPGDGNVSLNIKSADGTVVRQLLNCAFYTKGVHQVSWDGLTMPSAGVPGNPLPAGDYAWSALYNAGIGLKLRGWAANAGKAPWENGPGTNWGGDEGNPIATAADASQVYLGWSFAEAGQALLACDQNGNVKWKNKRGGLAGIKSLAAADGALYALGGTAGPDASGAAVYKLNPADGQYLSWGDSTDADLHVKNLWPDNPEAPLKADFLAAGGGALYLSFGATNQVLVLDGKTGKLVKTLALTAPGAIQVGSGKLYAISGASQVLEVDLTSGKSRVLIDGLAAATALALHGENLYVGTRDPDNQIKAFDLTGKPVTDAPAAIGQRGGRALLGTWTPEGLRFIQSLAVGADGKLWVAEQDSYPRRMSAWDPKTGKLWKEFFGATDYGALGGAIDPLDPNIMVGLGCEWKLDPATGRSTCVAVITREGMENARFGVGGNGRLYVAIAPGWTHDLASTSIFERTGEGQYKLRGKFYYENVDPKTRRPTSTRLWADANGDGLEQAEENTTAPGNLRFSTWYMALAPDMTLYAANGQFKVASYTAAGAPVYDIAHPSPMPGDASMANNGFLGSVDDRQVLYNGDYGKDRAWFTSYDVASGKVKWTYPNNFVGVHGSHNATPPEVGVIRGSYGMAGTARLPAPVGNIWVIGTNVGEWHILTEDGYYLTNLFQGDPLKQQWPADAIPGVVMSDVPPGMGGEDFGGSTAQGPDGKLYLQAGKTAFWNLEVTGLDTIVPIPGGKVSLSAADLPQAAALREARLQQVVGKRSLGIKKMAVNFTGNINADFKGGSTISYQKSEDATVRTMAAWDETNLYLAWEVKDETPWQNTAKRAEEMYTNGDTVDFQMGTDPGAKADRATAGPGDLRLSIGNLNGVPTAVLYRKVAVIKKPLVFSSGVIKSYAMDYVDTVADARIKLVKRANGYAVEAAIPLASLDFKPSEGLTLRGDFGVTYNGPDGGRTRLRNYWNNQHTGLVDDAVFELMMEPRNWGELQFTP